MLLVVKIDLNCPEQEQSSSVTLRVIILEKDDTRLLAETFTNKATATFTFRSLKLSQLFAGAEGGGGHLNNFTPHHYTRLPGLQTKPASSTIPRR